MMWPILGATPVARMARSDVKQLLLPLRGKGLRPRSVTGILRTLSTVLSEAVEDGKLSANPALRPGAIRLASPIRSRRAELRGRGVHDTQERDVA